MKEIATTSTTADHGNREKLDDRSGEKSQVAENRQKFELAREKANARARTIVKKEIVNDDEAEIELHDSLARARRLALSGKVPIKIAKANDIADQIAQRQKERGDEMEVTENSNTVIFNEAADFDARIRAAMQERKKLEHETIVQASATSDTMIDDAIEEEKKDETNLKEDEGAGVDWGAEQPLVAQGMAATLALLRNKGDLRESAQARLAGRQNDHRDEDDTRVRDGVKLEYRDEFGRQMTKKEAFRHLSYKFHGQHPGKKKKDKRLKALKEEIIKDKALSGEGSTAAMKALEKRQKKSGQAFVFLS